MSVPVETALRAWINARTSTLVGPGNPLSNGAFLRDQRSPADGAYAMVERSAESPATVVAEDGWFTNARLNCMVMAGTQQSAEAAAAALRSAFETLTGMPEWCGATGIRVLVADNHLGPVNLPQPPDSGELFTFQVSADFVLAAG